MITNTEAVKGIEYIQHAIFECTEKPDVRRIIIEENPNLASLALKVEAPTKRDIQNYNALPKPALPPRDLAAEIDNLKTRIEILEKTLR